MLYGKAREESVNQFARGFHYGGKDGYTVVELGFGL